jgi:hypothetical protein
VNPTEIQYSTPELRSAALLVLLNLASVDLMTDLNLARYGTLEPDDALAKATSNLAEPVRLFLSDYLADENVAVNTVAPLGRPVPKREAISMMVAVLSLLFVNKFKSIGAILLGPDNTGVMVRYTSSTDVEWRRITKLPIAGGVAWVS